MAETLDSLSALLTPETIGKISKAIGADEATVTKGLGAAGPVVLASLSESANTPEGADALMKKLPEETDGDLLGSLMGAATGGAGGTQADLVNSLLGAGANAIGGTLSQKLGFDVRPMLRLAVPIVAGIITKAAKEQNLDSSGLSSMLRTERDSFLSDPANQETAGLVSSALEAGREATALRQSFDDAEWMKVRLAPMAALYLVATASPSGSAGEIQELTAAVSVVSDTVKSVAPTSLIGTAFGGGLTKDELEVLKQDAPPTDRILGVIRDSAEIVAQKRPADAQAYRDLLKNVAQKSAEAVKEGGFLGFGGARVSKEEQRAIDDINAALG